MSDVRTQENTRPVRCQRSIYQVHYSLPKVRDGNMARPLAGEPRSVHAFSLQVAGHMKTQDRKYLGVLECDNGTILKPIIKEAQRREIEFYTRLASSECADLVELRKFVPEYYGCRKFTYNGYEQEYIVLENLTERMLEPCIMDVKIGRRTWDPLATEQKILSEQSKYARCKQEYAFCIPGMHVRRLNVPPNQPPVCHYGKEYGKKLHGPAVVNAIRTFLNGSQGGGLCRALVLQFLSELWKVQRWAARQTSVRLYSASLLLVYDATRLRECCGEEFQAQCRPPPRARRPSAPCPPPSPSFSGQLSPSGPVYKLTPAPTASFTPPPPLHSPWTEALDKLHHSHSFEHNYEEKLAKIKMGYRALLDRLAEDSPAHSPWGTVKVIDFAHAFFNEEDDKSHDDNFREGIDSFVKIFEEFLKETDDQVF